jgi:hypothetical protein
MSTPDDIWREQDRLYRQACYCEAHIAALWREQGLKPDRTMRILMKARRRIFRRQDKVRQAWEAIP